MLSYFTGLYTAIYINSVYIWLIYYLYVAVESLHSSSLEREEAEDLIKRHGGRVTGSVSKKTVITIDNLISLLLYRWIIL